MATIELTSAGQLLVLTTGPPPPAVEVSDVDDAFVDNKIAQHDASLEAHEPRESIKNFVLTLQTGLS